VTVKVAQVLSHDLILGLDFLERNQDVILATLNLTV